MNKTELMKQLIDLYQVGETVMSEDVSTIFNEYVLKLESELVELLQKTEK